MKLKFKLRLRRLQRRSATAQYDYSNAEQFAVELRNRFTTSAIPEAEKPGNSIQRPDNGNHSCAQTSCGDRAQQNQTKKGTFISYRIVSYRKHVLVEDRDRQGKVQFRGYQPATVKYRGYPQADPAHRVARGQASYFWSEAREREWGSLQRGSQPPPHQSGTRVLL